MPRLSDKIKALKTTGSGHKRKLTDFFCKASESLEVNGDRPSKVMRPTTDLDEFAHNNVEADREDQTGPQQNKKPNSKPNSCHKIGYNEKWSKMFPLTNLYNTEEDGINIDILLCSICRKHKTGGLNSSKSWTEDGYRLLRQDKISQHQSSDQHKYALSLEMNTKVDEMCQKVDSRAHKAIKDAVKVLFYIIKNNLSLDLFSSMVDMCIDVGATELSNLRLAKNAKYSSWDIVNELLGLLGDQVEGTILKEAQSSPTFSIMVDEVADITSKKHLAVCVKYLSNEYGTCKTAFLADVELADGTADVITNNIAKILEDKNLSTKKMNGFASDGTSVFTGKHNGVCKKLKDKNPEMISVHCKDHRLALASRDSFSQIAEMKKLDEVLENLYKYYKYSCKKTAQLKAVQEAFLEAPVAIKAAKHHRWLSHDQAVSSIVRTYKCLISHLESSALNSDPVGKGLLKHLKDPETLACLLLLADVLPIISSLSLFFQRRDVNIGMVKSMVDKTLRMLQNRKSQDGPWLLKHHTMLEEIGYPSNSFKMSDFNKNVTVPFLDKLVDNIDNRFKDVDTIDASSILDLSNTYLDDSLPILYGRSEICLLCKYFDLQEEDTLSQWQDFLELIKSIEGIKVDLNGLLELFFSISNQSKNLNQQYPLVAKLVSIACLLPLSSAEVERVFSQLKLIKSSQRNRLSTINLQKLLVVKLNCDQELFDNIVDIVIKKFFERKQRRISSII